MDSYILMQRIFPPIHSDCTLVRNEQGALFDTVSELGVFTAFLSDGHGSAICNKFAGFILRTKPADADEGGVAAGFAVLDSPLLY